MVEVFKTNIELAHDAADIIQLLSQYFPGARINFDLQDCDRILRMEGIQFSTTHVMQLVQQNGFHCEILE